MAKSTDHTDDTISAEAVLLFRVVTPQLQSLLTEIRELSKKFDNWEPKDFRLSPAEVERAIAQVRKRDLDDIKFAQAQVRNFAQKQKETLRDLEVETLPGVVLGHKHIPVSSIGCWSPSRRWTCWRSRWWRWPRPKTGGKRISFSWRGARIAIAT